MLFIAGLLFIGGPFAIWLAMAVLIISISVRQPRWLAANKMRASFGSIGSLASARLNRRELAFGRHRI